MKNKKQQKHAWKLLRRVGYRSLASAFSHIGLKYSLTESTYPNKNDNQFLFVFGTRREARQYNRRFFHNRRELYKVEVPELMTECKNRKGITIYATSGNFPYGTRFVKYLKIIKRA